MYRLSDERINLLEVQSETLRPVSLKKRAGLVGRLVHLLRICCDLQYASVRADVVRFAGAFRGVVLDVGCGGMPFRDCLPLDCTYIGLDSSESAQKFGYGSEEVTLFEGGMFPQKDESVDNVLMTEVLEHIEDPSATIGQCHRVLRCGGQLVMTVPFAARWHFVPFDYWRYTPSGLCLLFNKNEWADVAVYARGGEATVISYKVATYLFTLILGSDTPIRRVLKCAAGVLSLPILSMCLLLGHLSLANSNRVVFDSLGYTLVARKR
jgi:SAM-dependent methyltransferase